MSFFNKAVFLPILIYLTGIFIARLKSFPEHFVFPHINSFGFETRSCYVIQASLETESVSLPLSPCCWDYRCHHPSLDLAVWSLGSLKTRRRKEYSFGFLYILHFFPKYRLLCSLSNNGEHACYKNT